MKTVIIVLVLVLVFLTVLGAVCLGVCGGLAWFGISVYQNITSGAEEFLALTGQEKFEEAYQEAASGLRQAESLESFTEKIQSLGLDGYLSSNWSQFDLRNDLATIGGTVTTKSGVVPLKITLVNEKEKWRVLQLERAPMGNAPSRQPDLSVPNER